MLVLHLEKLSRRFNFHFVLMPVVVFGASLLLASTVFGQTITGAISGTVVDPNGANVPGLNVETMVRHNFNACSSFSAR